ncbi:hypothetical protein FB45DRAFT_1024450 [Roridomyces roridus]|uniref:NAD(P)-binding protein n=1 Tax=Roridomyces roridus TaxID=1738132 RepID=A0AAD7FPK4_9AGAR|nr:hypothetical protein FB45DRAFT_1024450 [Roridomyces roridus]
MSTPTRVWLITGASSGFGRLITEKVLAEGEIAAAAVRTPSALNDLAVAHPDRLLVVKCDVTKPTDIHAAFAEATAKFGRVDVVFNNAGYAIAGEIEGLPEDASRAMFEVNFWGALNVSKEAVRVFRDVNPPNAGGRLLNVSSGNGFCGVPVLGMYSASKHALEGLTESLHLEMDPAWNIKISIIAPGAFKTGTHSDPARTPVFPAPEAYHKDLPSHAVRHWLQDGSGIQGDPRKAVDAMFRFSKLESPPLRWAVGKDSVGGTKAKLEKMGGSLVEFESWSDDLEITSV